MLTLFSLATAGCGMLLGWPELRPSDSTRIQPPLLKAAPCKTFPGTQTEAELESSEARPTGSEASPAVPDPSDPHERKDCLHCSINELLQLSGREAHEELVDLLQCAGERLAVMTLQGADKHDILGQSVSALDHAVSYTVMRHAKRHGGS